jgi:cell division transport system permease protein
MKGAHWTTAISTVLGVASTLAVLGLVVAAGGLSQALGKEVKAGLRMQVELVARTTTEQGPQIAAKIASWPQVLEAEYIDPETAAIALEQELGTSFMTFLGESPLPPSVELRLHPDAANSDAIHHLETLLLGLNGAVRVDAPWSIIRHLEGATTRWFWPVTLLFLALLALSAAQIYHVIKLSVHGRRFVIRSMELVGARPRMIRRPFFWEGMGYGFVGGVLAFAAVITALGAFRPMAPALFSHITPTHLASLAAVLTSAGLLIAGGSSFWAVRSLLGASLDRLH